MDTSRSDRWLALLGPLFLVLMVVVMALSGSTPGENWSGQRIITHYHGKVGVNLAAAFLVGPAVVALLLFVSAFRLQLSREVGAPRKLVQYGAVVYGVALLMTAVVSLAEVSAADDKQAGAAQAMNYLNNAGWIPIVIGAGALLIGAGWSVLRSGILPSWLGWISLVVGVISLLGPGGFVGFFVAPIWVAVAGVMLYMRPEAAPPTVIA
ncbi:MAG: hypothetical protein QOJ79_2643 [Actinomycetota bacterium]|jgi:fumarate reductase subunit D|nr:hypothetical protein [Actinomycetota bacterium]